MPGARHFLLGDSCVAAAAQELKLGKEHLPEVLKELNLPEDWQAAWNPSRDKKGAAAGLAPRPTSTSALRFACWTLSARPTLNHPHGGCIPLVQAIRALQS